MTFRLLACLAVFSALLGSAIAGPTPRTFKGTVARRALNDKYLKPSNVKSVDVSDKIDPHHKHKASAQRLAKKRKLDRAANGRKTVKSVRNAGRVRKVARVIRLNRKDIEASGKKGGRK